MKVTNRDNSQHYNWGEGCVGWYLTTSSDLLVVEERMPPNAAEVMHYHEKSRQYFYVISGELTMCVDNTELSIHEGSGIEIEQRRPHQAMNKSSADCCFLVISSPSPRGDKVILE